MRSRSRSSTAAVAPGMASTEGGGQDPYLDPGTGLLRNNPGLGEQRALDAFEAERTEIRALQLLQSPPAFTGDLKHLQAIHRHLFQDVYDWAGQLRTVDIAKQDGEHFMPMSLLQRGAGYAFDELRQDSFLRGMQPDRFVARLAHHYDQINYLHPFREGNGRTQRMFWSQVAVEAGYELDWSHVSGAVNDHASRAAHEQRDLDPLRDMFRQVVLDRIDPELGAADQFANSRKIVARGMGPHTETREAQDDRPRQQEPAATDDAAPDLGTRVGDARQLSPEAARARAVSSHGSPRSSRCSTRVGVPARNGNPGNQARKDNPTRAAPNGAAPSRRGHAGSRCSPRRSHAGSRCSGDQAESLHGCSASCQRPRYRGM